MMARTIKNPGIFAGDAQTTIPPTPVVGESYRDPVDGLANIRKGWPYSITVNSPEFAQIMHQITSLTDLIDRTGILEYKDDVEYDIVPAYVVGSDGQLYTSTAANGPGSTVVDPVGDLSGVWVLPFQQVYTPAQGTDTYTAPIAPAPVDTQFFRVLFENANTGPATLNGKSIKKSDNSDPEAGALDGKVELEFDVTTDAFLIVTGGGGGTPARVWNDVKASRTYAVGYTNTLNYPIVVSVSSTNNTANTQVEYRAEVDGLEVSAMRMGYLNMSKRLNVYFEVPAGATYTVSQVGSPVVSSWVELF